MLHIHYTEGPESLRDVSIEISNRVNTYLTEGYSDSDIMNIEHISQNVLDDIKNIRKLKLRRCCFCGALFDPKGRSRRITCFKPDHYLPCIDCGAPVRVNESYANYMNAGGRRCPTCRSNQIGATRRGKSEEEKAAIVAKQQATMIERYGAATPLQVPEIKAQIQATIKEKYGVDNLSQSKEIQDKIREHSQEKYGVDHYTSAPEVRARMIQGMINKYGVSCAQKSPELREKTRQTNLKRYGCENVFQNEQVRQTFVDNHLAKYGVAWPHQRPDLIEKVRQTNIDKYGAPMFPISDDYMQTVISDPSKFDKYKEFMNDPEFFIQNHYVSKPTVAQICYDIGVTDTTVYDKLISIGKRDLATEYNFTLEVEILEFISKLDPSISIEKHNRAILNRKEIDIYLPDCRIGFECNPTYTHNSSFLDPWGELPKHYKYHAEKSREALDKGVFIYHVFGYEWNHRRAVIESQIANLLGKNKYKIYARNTVIKEVSSQDASQFLNDNHRQGSVVSPVRLGLYTKDDDKLVSIMTFGKMRNGIGKKSDQSDNEFELVRFCNLMNTSVVGAASKLFKYFLSNYQPDKVVSFSDLAHTRGGLYSKLGFNQISISDPGYVWVRLKDDTWLNRVTCQKNNLPRLFDDVSIEYIQSHTENEIMMEHGYARVYDSGVIRWEYVPESSGVNV